MSARAGASQVLGTQTRERERPAGELRGPLPLFQQAKPNLRPVRHRTMLFRLVAAPFVAAFAARRIFVLLPFAMILGMMLYAVLPFEPHALALGAVVGVLLICVPAAWQSNRLPLVVLFAAFWGGVCLLPLHGFAFGTTMLARPAYGTFEATVDEVLSSTPDGQRVVISQINPMAGERAVPVVRARVLVPADPRLLPGDHITGTFRLVPVPGPILPGAFDGQFQSFFSGIGAYGTLTGDFVATPRSESFDMYRSIEWLRNGIGRRIDAALEGASAAIGRAMVMGDQSGITDDTRELMAASGLAHIYSISGLHLSIVAGGMFWLVRLCLAALPGLAIRLPVKKLAACSGLIAAAGYMLLAGGVANVPALRSAMMLGLIFGAVLVGRRALTMRNVAIAALLIIVIDPASVFRPSFQLSFAAVVALIGIYEMPRRTASLDRALPFRIGALIWTTGMTSFIAGAATLVFSAYHFQQTAPLGVIGNVLVLPVVGLIIMPFALLSVLAMPFGLESPLVKVMGWGIDRMVDVAALVAGWSEGLTGNPLLTTAALCIGLGSLGWFAFFNNWWRLLGPAIALPLILLFGLDQRPDLLIADSTQAIAMRLEDGNMGLVTGKTGSFAVDVWSQHYQQVIAPSIPEGKCDSLGCIARTERYSVAVVKNAAAFEEDCGGHDLIITRLRRPTLCLNKQIIDADDLSRGGVHWLLWNADAARFDVRTAIPNVTRPWRVSPR